MGGEDPGVTYSIKTRVGDEGESGELSKESFDNNVKTGKLFK